jgi:SAM-dependent methyltransferase
MEPESAISLERFDEAYFDRYYERLESRVHGPTEVGHLVRGIAGLAAYWGIPVTSVLDVGAGPGFYRDAVLREFPGAKYTSIDISPVACARYGHTQASVVDYAPGEVFDLVVCQGVLQYLPSALCHKALKNLDKLCAGLLYLEALTVHDVEEVADLSKTDDDVFLRTGEWYRRRLQPNFVTVGAGLHCSRRATSVFFELERADS